MLKLAQLLCLEQWFPKMQLGGSIPLGTASTFKHYSYVFKILRATTVGRALL